ncbi:efflux RND transporter periplasmic adaptor subunit [Altererythrobacter aquiaggeris]|uniref:efflux RND transporter periplasmic adaptor subunit n=1 Tax=Aestuarierythrobacter aquiaggeris TaxID=1898396 RepID=UPI003018D479
MNYETGITMDDGHPDISDARFDLDAGDERRPRRKWIILITGLLILGAAIAAWYIMQGSTNATPAADNTDQAPSITVITPGKVTIAGEIVATGSLAARREVPVGVVGEGGRVVSVAVDAGQFVRQGQLLVSIDRSVQNQQAASQSAQIEVARSDARLAQANLDRALKLVERGFISQADIDRLTATRDAAASRVKVAQAQLGELRARNARLNVYAPAGGLVLSRDVEPGQVVSGGSPPLFVIAKGGEMELLANLGETDLARISTGVQADVTPVGADKVFSGQVWQIAPIIDQQNRQGTARISLPYAPELRPGGFASAVIKSGTVVAPQLPESALQSDEEGSYVYIVGKDNKVERRRIELGSVTAKGVTIRSGLTGNEKIVLRAGGFLNPGETVKPVLAKD